MHKHIYEQAALCTVGFLIICLYICITQICLDFSNIPVGLLHKAEHTSYIWFQAVIVITVPNTWEN